MAVKEVSISELTSLYENMMAGRNPKPQEATRAIGALLKCVTSITDETKAQKNLTDLFQWKVIELSNKIVRLEAEKELWAKDRVATSHDGLITETMMLQLELLDAKQNMDTAMKREEERHDHYIRETENRIIAMRLELAEKALIEKRVWELRDHVLKLNDKIAELEGEKLQKLSGNASTVAKKSKSQRKKQSKNSAKTTAPIVEASTENAVDELPSDPNDDGHTNGVPELTGTTQMEDDGSMKQGETIRCDKYVQTVGRYREEYNILTDDGF